MGSAATLFGGVCMAVRCLAFGHRPRVRRCAGCHRLAAVAVVPCINASHRRRAKARARRRAGFKGHLVVELRLVVGQRQKGAVVVAAHDLGFRAMTTRRLRWRRRRTRWRRGVRAKRACRDGRDDRARSRDVSVSACPRLCRGQLNIFKVDRAGVSLPAAVITSNLSESQSGACLTQAIPTLVE